MIGLFSSGTLSSCSHEGHERISESELEFKNLSSLTFSFSTCSSISILLPSREGFFFTPTSKLLVHAGHLTLPTCPPGILSLWLHVGQETSMLSDSLLFSILEIEGLLSVTVDGVLSVATLHRTNATIIITTPDTAPSKAAVVSKGSLKPSDGN